MSCFDNIVSVKDYCNLENNTSSSSGYDLMDAPEISSNGLSATLNKDVLDARGYALEHLRMAQIDVRNDFLGVLSANSFSANIAATQYTTTVFNSEVVLPANIERGIVFHKVNSRPNSIRKTVINEIILNANEAQDNVLIKIYDGGSVTTLTVKTINGMNTYKVDYTVNSATVRVVLAANSISVMSGKLTCFVGCNNTMPNKCGHTKSYNGAEVSNKESYGLGLTFSCECDYDKLLCDLSKPYIGKLLYLKSRIILLDSRIASDRFSSFIVYGVDEAKAKRVELIAEYNQSWNVMVQSLPSVLKAYNGECITCNGISWKVNV